MYNFVSFFWSCLLPAVLSSTLPHCGTLNNSKKKTLHQSLRLCAKLTFLFVSRRRICLQCGCCTDLLWRIFFCFFPHFNYTHQSCLLILPPYVSSQHIQSLGIITKFFSSFFILELRYRTQCVWQFSLLWNDFKENFCTTRWHSVWVYKYGVMLFSAGYQALQLVSLVK